MTQEQEKIQQESALVKSIGDMIGYGHMMQLASAHWRKVLKEKGYPESGAFVPVVDVMVKKSDLHIVEKSANKYDRLIDVKQTNNQGG